MRRALCLMLLFPNAVLAQIDPLPAGEFRVFTDESLATPGLVGSYVNKSLHQYQVQDDWRQSQAISGTRVDNPIDFPTDNWGSRAEVGITGGSDQNWDRFSVQWDGVVHVVTDGLRLATISDDSSRMWVDLNHDGVFDPAPPEFLNNHWGSDQAPTRGDISAPMAPGVYPVRIQYQERFGGNRMRLAAIAPATIRLGYVVASDRTPRSSIPGSMRELATIGRTWMAGESAAYGVGPIVPRYELEGGTPKVHTINSQYTAAQMREDVWARTLDSAAADGAALYGDGEVWLLISDCQEQTPDGAIHGGVALGAGYGSGRLGGVAVIGAETLAGFPLPGGLVDDREYDGLIVPEIGPYPLVQNVSFPWFGGTTVSELISGATGAAWHELGHAFGLAHDFRCDENFHGDLMGNGLRGMRGAVHPDRYPQHETRLGMGEAHRMARCPFLRPDDESGYVEDVRPAITILTQGSVPVVDGHITIRFQASDAGGLAGAMLRRDGAYIEEMELDDDVVEAEFRTPWFDPELTNGYEIVAYDRQGNASASGVNLDVGPTDNAAPRPFFKAVPARAEIGADIVLDASGSSDIDDATGSLRVEWDLDGDGTFDTAPTTLKTRVVAYPEAGSRLVRLRITDPSGAVSVSTPIPVRIGVPPCPADLDGNGTLNLFDFLAFQTLFSEEDPRADLAPPFGVFNLFDFLAFQTAFGNGCE